MASRMAEKFHLLVSFSFLSFGVQPLDRQLGVGSGGRMTE